MNGRTESILNTLLTVAIGIAGALLPAEKLAKHGAADIKARAAEMVGA